MAIADPTQPSVTPTPISPSYTYGPEAGKPVTVKDGNATYTAANTWKPPTSLGTQTSQAPMPLAGPATVGVNKNGTSGYTGAEADKRNYTSGITRTVNMPGGARTAGSMETRTVLGSPVTPVPLSSGIARPVAKPTMTPGSGAVNAFGAGIIPGAPVATPADPNKPATTTATSATAVSPLGVPTDTKPVKLDTSSPDFAETAGAQVRKMEAEKQITNLANQQASTRMQFMQQLQDAGQKGSTIGTLAMLKDRELNSAMSGLQWNLTSNYLEALDKHTETARLEGRADDIAAKAQFSASMAAAMESGDYDGFTNLSKVASELYPDDKYLQYMADPANVATLKASMTPQMQIRKQTALDNAVKSFAGQYDIFNTNDLKQNSGTLLADARTGYSAAELKMLGETISDSTVADYAKEYFPSMDMSSGIYPDSMRQDAALMKNIQTRLSHERAIQGENAAADGLVDYAKLNSTSAGILQKAIGILAQDPGAEVKLAGVTVPGTAFDGGSSGASSIFYSDWDGDTNFANRSPLSDALDATWMNAVKTAGGDLNVDRATFQKNFGTAASELGVDLYTAQKASPALMKQIADKMKSMGLVGPADAGPGSTTSVAAAASSGNNEDLYRALSQVTYGTPQSQQTVDAIRDGLEAQGKTVTAFTPPTATTPWAWKAGEQWMVANTGGANGDALVRVTMGEPYWSNDDKLYHTTVTVRDPSGNIAEEPYDLTVPGTQMVVLNPEVVQKQADKTTYSKGGGIGIFDSFDNWLEG